MSKSVQTYYDRNTAKFLRFGKHGKTLSLHQAIWAPGISSLSEAQHFIHQFVEKEIRDLKAKMEKSPLEVWDLGCGVGASIFYLAHHFKTDIQLTGLSISPVQIEYARKMKAKIGQMDHCQFFEADFLLIPAELKEVHLAFAIEAFIHARDPNQFFQRLGKRLIPGGRIMICDDFLTNKGQKALQQSDPIQWIQDFKAGWHADSLMSLEAVTEMAEKAGFTLVRSQDFSAYLRLGRFRDRLIGMAYRLLRKSMMRTHYFKGLAGGYAKQQCLKQDLLSYNLLVFEKN